MVFLTVYVCPGGGSCSTRQTVRLKVKVGITDPSGVPVPEQREITVLVERAAVGAHRPSRTSKHQDAMGSATKIEITAPAIMNGPKGTAVFRPPGPTR